MRLIDADALMEQVKAIHKAVDTSRINQEYNTGFHSATSQMQGLVAYMPTIEAKPVVRGEWEAVPSSDMVTGKAYECSQCRKMRFGSFKPNYCPNCGSDMRERKEGE